MSARSKEEEESQDSNDDGIKYVSFLVAAVDTDLTMLVYINPVTLAVEKVVGQMEESEAEAVSKIMRSIVV